MEVTKYSRYEACQHGDSPTCQPPKNPKEKSAIIFYLKVFFFRFYSFGTEEKLLHENEQKDLRNDELVSEVKSFLDTWNLRSKEVETKEVEPLCWWNLKKWKYPHLVNFARRYLSEPPSSVQTEGLFHEAGNLKKLAKTHSRVFKNWRKAFISPQWQWI